MARSPREIRAAASRGRRSPASDRNQRGVRISSPGRRARRSRRSRGSNAPQIFRPFAWPGIARARFPQSSCSSLPYHPGLNLGGVFDSGRHRAGAVEQPSKINSIDASDGQRNATRWPVRQHVAIASANCMPWRINVPNTHSRP
ncbi:hypothetical protein PAHAL_1G399600 [Panicum hallii]|uniref:Uncharacterized protein n=1 Tax=Panicum hallii TaxID=206008 RepID=A0A2T8KXW0_9POAL|nr:hypothetical protein PAHAL_1G399600 [Panicum hallii]